jgi:hypothetical protein
MCLRVSNCFLTAVGAVGLVGEERGGRESCWIWRAREWCKLVINSDIGVLSSPDVASNFSKFCFAFSRMYDLSLRFR